MSTAVAKLTKWQRLVRFWCCYFGHHWRIVRLDQRAHSNAVVGDKFLHDYRERECSLCHRVEYWSQTRDEWRWGGKYKP